MERKKLKKKFKEKQINSDNENYTRFAIDFGNIDAHLFRSPAFYIRSLSMPANVMNAKVKTTIENALRFAFNWCLAYMLYSTHQSTSSNVSI